MTLYDDFMTLYDYIHTTFQYVKWLYVTVCILRQVCGALKNVVALGAGFAGVVPSLLVHTHTRILFIHTTHLHGFSIHTTRKYILVDHIDTHIRVCVCVVAPGAEFAGVVHSRHVHTHVHSLYPYICILHVNMYTYIIYISISRCVYVMCRVCRCCALSICTYTYTYIIYTYYT